MYHTLRHARQAGSNEGTHIHAGRRSRDAAGIDSSTLLTGLYKNTTTRAQLWRYIDRARTAQRALPLFPCTLSPVLPTTPPPGSGFDSAWAGKPRRTPLCVVGAWTRRARTILVEHGTTEDRNPGTSRQRGGRDKGTGWQPGGARRRSGSWEKMKGRSDKHRQWVGRISEGETRDMRDAQHRNNKVHEEGVCGFMRGIN